MSRYWTRTVKSSPTTPGWCADAASAPRGSSRSRLTGSRQPRSGIYNKRAGQTRPPEVRSGPDGRRQREVPLRRGVDPEAAVREDRQRHDDRVGTIYFLRSGNSTQVGARFDPPNAQTLEYKNGAVTIYTAGTNQIKTYSAGQNQALAQTILALGAGGSGRDLFANWIITDQGTEQMSDGSHMVEVEKLDLVSKDHDPQFLLHPHRHLDRPGARSLAETGGFHAFGRHPDHDLHQHPPQPAHRPEAICHQVQRQVQLRNLCIGHRFERAGL